MNLESPALSKKVKEDTFFTLNNLLNIPKDGRIQLDKDKEAVKAYFLEYVNPNTVFFYTLDEKLDYLVENEYIKEDFLTKYTRDFVKKLFKKIYNKKFRFRTFMGAYKFYSQYAMKTNDGKRFLERYEDRLAFNALALADGNEQLALDFADELIHQRYQPATPTFLNIGKKRAGEMVSCFLLTVSDDMNSIGRSINSALQLSKLGGGVGISLSNIRANNDPIRGVYGLADGVVPVMKLFEDAFSYANQGGARDGAGVVYLNVFHPDIVDFLSVRKENADEKVRIKTLSLGLIVPDKFYELIKNNDYMYLFSPHDVEKVYGKPFAYIDITKEYDKMVENPNIRKSKIKARDLETEISNLQNESGYPYIINIDTVNRANPIDGKVIMSNLCTEIFQVQRDSMINNDQTYEILGNDVSCNLGSTNVVNLMSSPDFGKSVRTMLRALTYVTDNSRIDVVPPVKNGNDMYHSVGLGAMNLHGYLAKSKIHYGSPEALEFTDIYFMLLNYWTLVESNNISIETGQVFSEFEKSKYATGEYFNKYLEEPEFEFKHEKVKDLFKDIFIPRHKDWLQLKESVMEHGLYNAYRLAVAPTGSISYVNEATASIHPITQRIEERTEGKRGKVYYPAPYLSNETIPYYESAYDIDQRKIIDTYATAQKHVDQGLSMTLFLRSELPYGMYEWKIDSEYPTKKTTRDLSILRNYAWKQGIKSVYYIRTYTDDGTEVGANYCESCSI
ncbi:class 1b ribonucleoside-diphosphate reductase subunit alpha [Heyndrickxia oleronia]|jgi:ribonucleoside-diphosphate reductase alpha chain|uniref:class 1b ribonucleoside-diphosphate reductase subunit alpha n=1 Tax=Heyndrickxia oleronia TaxID=38875 RepID=UPI001B2EEBE4|nr:class 1b ribonucleoside-diphosphate reductase subunit alpha [Heyndrickxia oleronia]MCI1589035.1 class 1b ribonucleoside-diphosphate reductase subunit alpha [Heyndrickxia oleronia]MCI1611873.1 class 1b ribonucleoside-diphosphate reductase subunit alpha [Heyndrickxia oleronia]MCI1743120.1 class 1b ribonucleoside-diphosphate reductase subunit alpha [Heyndrickxia oleronia]MCI1759614.1 class 1b ribonucleoside-diphosphate reductase subunit alpha [Heyndrickxia oleronia]GIN40813.1 ribonucleoside-di